MPRDAAPPRQGTWASVNLPQGCQASCSTGRREYAVRYRRDGREFRQVRFFQSRPAVDRFLGRLMGDDRWWLAPLVEVTVETREVGPWTVQELVR